MPTVLVTGGAGYIGSHTCVKLIESGYDVVVVDSLHNSKFEAIRRVGELTGRDIPFYQVNLLDRSALETVFQKHAIDAVIHFAGFKAVGESVEAPLKYYYNNVAGTLVLCETMDKFNVRNLVFSSSATVYGVPDRVPIDEGARLQATNPYGQSKLIIEQILRDLYRSNQQWSIALLRYFNPVGAHASGRIGEDPRGIPNNLFPYITQVATGRLDRLRVFGNDYPTRDGTGVRDYIHVCDLAAGHKCALDFILSGSGIDAFNLGTGMGYSVLEVVQAFERIIGKEIPYTIEARRPGDVAECYASTEYAKAKLGWAATKNIDDMCEDAWRWQSNNPEGYVMSEFSIGKMAHA